MCLNCTSIGCRNGICEKFKEKFIYPVINNQPHRSKKVIEYKGEKHTLAEWSELTGIPLATLCNRRKHGKTGERLFAPIRKRE